MREIRVFAPAKLNLYLDVLEKRDDGFHNIETIFEKIDLKDEIIIREKGKGLRVSVSPCICGNGKDNIVYKAAKALFKEAGTALNLDIKIKKHIPVSAGLGGGSSDAASAMRAINEIFKLGLSEKKLFSISSDIGKDAPFFMMDNSFAFAEGAGEKLKKINLKKEFFHILIKPSIPLSTKMMYQRIDDSGFSGGRRSLKNVLFALKKGAGELEKNYYNIFERVLAGDSGHIERAKAVLSRAGARHSLLSGSGPTVFCSFDKREEAEEIFKNISGFKDAEVFLAKTYKGGIYGDNRS